MFEMSQNGMSTRENGIGRKQRESPNPRLQQTVTFPLHGTYDNHVHNAQFQDNELYDLVSTCCNTVHWDTINTGNTRSDKRATHTSVPR